MISSGVYQICSDSIALAYDTNAYIADNMLSIQEEVQEESFLIINDNAAQMINKEAGNIYEDFTNYGNKIIIDKTIVAMQEHVLAHYGLLNDFLSENGIKVQRTFATLSETLGYPIDEQNIAGTLYIWDADGTTINSATEETLTLLYNSDAPPDISSTNEKTVTLAEIAEPLVAVSTPCKAIWIGAPVTQTTGLAENTKLVLIGDSSNQIIPLVQDNFQGFIIQISDAATVYIKVGVDGESVRYLILT